MLEETLVSRDFPRLREREFRFRDRASLDERESLESDTLFRRRFVRMFLSIVSNFLKCTKGIKTK